MTFVTSYYHRTTGGNAKISLYSEDLSGGRLTGEIQLEQPDLPVEPARYTLSESQDALVNPYEISIESIPTSHSISIRITGPDPKFTFQSDQTTPEDEQPVFHFELPSIQTLSYCHRFLRNGVTEDLHTEIDKEYDHDRSSILVFIRDTKYCLAFPDYVELLADAGTVDEQAFRDLKHSRHGFFKNLIRGQGAGQQFPIRNHEEFISRVREYNSHDELEPIDQTRVIEKLLDDASSHGTTIDELCSLEQTFLETAADLKNDHFINLITESLLTDFDVATATTRFDNEFQVSPWSLVKQRSKDWSVERSFEELREDAYDSHSIDDWEHALAAVNSPESQQFFHALAGLLYWYTETTDEFPKELQPKVYATAAKLFDHVDNEFMADAAAYRASLEEGFFRRQHDDYENARQEFITAIAICDSRDKGPFNEVHAFIESIETDIEEYSDKGQFMEAFQKAEYGFKELTEGQFKEHETDSFELRLMAWKDDLQAQNQRANGQFEEAIETTNNAIAGFRSANLNGRAQTAQARLYQLKAIQAQLDLDFDKAANHHRNAQEESVSRDTIHVHKVHADICTVKQHLLEDEIESAREEVKELNQEESTVNNLRVLIDVYEDYRSEEKSSVSEVVDQLATEDDEGEEENRHISYHGDYISAVVHVVAAQRLGQQNVPSPVLDHITQAAIKNAVSGGASHEWAEISELSQIDAENAWRLLIPSVIQNDLEYIEYNAEKGSHPNYSMSGLKLLAVLEGYLRVLVEYYAKLEYGNEWVEEVISRKNITLGDIYTFFESDEAAERISVRDNIRSELDDVRYFDANSNITDVRNDLGHETLSEIDEEVFQDLKDHVFEIMRRSAFDCPVIAEIENVHERHQIYFAAADLK